MFQVRDSYSVVRTLQEQPGLGDSAKRKMPVANVARFYGVPILQSQFTSE